MAAQRLYENWNFDLSFWQEKLRHLEWVSAYRLDIIRENLDLQGKRALDMGSGPQFTSALLEKAGAQVMTLDKYAPCSISFDINDDFTQCLPDAAFDLVVIGAVIRYVEDKALFFSRLHKILAPSGLIFLDEFVHSPLNDVFLEFMSLFGAMEQWPTENFTPFEDLSALISRTPGLSIKEIYSCWPSFFLKGQIGFPTWYSLIIKKK